MATKSKAWQHKTPRGKTIKNQKAKHTKNQSVMMYLLRHRESESEMLMV